MSKQLNIPCKQGKYHACWILICEARRAVEAFDNFSRIGMTTQNINLEVLVEGCVFLVLQSGDIDKIVT